MSDPAKCMTLCPSADAPAEQPAAPARRRLSDRTVRLIEDWIVGVVTVLSAAVILATVIAHRDPPTPVHELAPDSVAVVR